MLPTVLGVSEPPSYSGDLFSPADYDVFDRLDQASRDTALEPLALHVLSRSGYATWAAGGGRNCHSGDRGLQVVRRRVSELRRELSLRNG
jgi:hypothetical protein